MWPSYLFYLVSQLIFKNQLKHNAQICEYCLGTEYRYSTVNEYDTVQYRYDSYFRIFSSDFLCCIKIKKVCILNL